MEPAIISQFLSTHKFVLSDKAIKYSMENYFIINQRRNSYNYLANVIQAIYDICDLDNIKWLQFLFSIAQIQNLENSWGLAFDYCCTHKKINLAKWLYDNELHQTSGFFKIIHTAPEEECSICYGTAELKTGCDHYYCKECFFEWYKKKLEQTQCPMCREKINIKDCSIFNNDE